MVRDLPSYFHRFPLSLVKGKGSFVYDSEGNKYLYLTGGDGNLLLGHAPTPLLSAMHKQAKLLGQVALNQQPVVKAFYHTLCELTGQENALLLSSEAEAVDLALKLARMWGYTFKAVPEDKAEVLFVDECDHGNTLALISASTLPGPRERSGPFLPGVKHLPFGSVEAFEQLITPHTCGIVVEPIQKSSGIRLPPKGWLKHLKQVCHKKDLLFIVDECRSGLGRAGAMTVCAAEQVKPDVLILGGGLTGGLIPAACLAGKKECLEQLVPGAFRSTFAENPIAAAVGQAMLARLKAEKWADKSRKMGSYFLKALESMQSPYVKEVHGMGLMIGLEIKPRKILASHVANALLDRGILVRDVHETMLCLTPPLNITRAQIDWAMKRIRDVLWD